MQRAVLGFEPLVSLDGQGIENAVALCLDGGAAQLPRDQPHLADGGVRPEAAHANRASVLERYDDADAAVENEVHAVGRLTLRGDDGALAHVEPAAMQPAKDEFGHVSEKARIGRQHEHSDDRHDKSGEATASASRVVQGGPAQ